MASRIGSRLVRGGVLVVGGLMIARVATDTHGSWEALAVRLVAPALFLFALWATTSVFAAVDRGRDFDPAMTRAMSWTGGGLLLGAWASWLFEPMMLHLIGNGFLEARGVTLNYTVQNLTLAAVGAVLILLARRGRVLRGELEAFV